MNENRQYEIKSHKPLSIFGWYNLLNCYVQYSDDDGETWHRLPDDSKESVRILNEARERIAIECLKNKGESK